MKHSVGTLAFFTIMSAWPALASAQDNDNPFGYPERIPTPPAAPQPAPPEAVTPAPAQPEAPAVAPSADPTAQPVPQWAPTAAPFTVQPAPSQANDYYADIEAGTRPAPRRGLVFIPRIGALLSGRATLKNDIKCPREFEQAYLSNFSGIGQVPALTPCLPVLGTAADEDFVVRDSSSVLVGADLLYHATPSLRVGGSALWNPASEISVTDSSAPFRLGAEISADVTLEHVFAESKSTGLFYRVMAGPTLLLTGGDLEVAVEREKKLCRELLKLCEIDSGPFLGYNVAAGIGALFPVDKSALRFDLLLNYVTLPFRHIQATAEDQDRRTTADADTKEEAAFVRLWLSVGTEI